MTAQSAAFSRPFLRVTFDVLFYPPRRRRGRWRRRRERFSGKSGRTASCARVRARVREGWTDRGRSAGRTVSDPRGRGGRAQGEVRRGVRGARKATETSREKQ